MTSIASAIQSFLDDLVVSYTDQTVATYTQGMLRFKEFLRDKNYSSDLEISTLTAEHAITFAHWLTDEREITKGKIARSTRRTYLSAIMLFYRFLLREKLIDLSLSDFERMKDTFHGFRHGHQSLPQLPPDEAVTALLNAARNVKLQPKKPRLELVRSRNIAMLEALRSSGMRVGELVGLKRDDLDHRNHSARVTGKGDKQRIVYFDDKAWQAIQEYLKARNDGERGRALYQLPLFARHDRRASHKTLPLTTDTVRLVFNQLARDAQIEITMTPHSLRHAFATRVLEATSDLAVVQDMLGHASPETTRIYAKVSNKKMREAHRAAFGYRGEDEKS